VTLLAAGLGALPASDGPGRASAREGRGSTPGPSGTNTESAAWQLGMLGPSHPHWAQSPGFGRSP
jgi:hypothetical protein